MLSPHELVKEVAKLLEEDCICYVNRESREILSIEIANIKSMEQASIVSELEKNISKYIKCKPMPKQKLLWVMQRFVLETTDDEIKKELSSSLSRKNPTRNFLQIIESRQDIKQHWVLFKLEENATYVSELFIADYNY